MRVNEACKESDMNCPFYTGVCRNQFGQFKCKNCARNKDASVLTYASDRSPIWNRCRVLIFTHELGPNGRDIRRRIGEWYRDAPLDYLNYQHLLCGMVNQHDLDHIVDNLKSDRYIGIYIDTQNKRERRAVRQYFKDKYDLDLHIGTYAKLAAVIERYVFRK